MIESHIKEIKYKMETFLEIIEKQYQEIKPGWLKRPNRLIDKRDPTNEHTTEQLRIKLRASEWRDKVGPSYPDR